MGLDSYLELFTTMYGWAFARIIWDVLKDTGIIYLPLLITIIDVWMEAHEMGEEGGGPQWMVRKM
ncbi:MAG TPA: conjugal transfer protein TraG, partial [Noviherbaspirillum sp.]